MPSKFGMVLIGPNDRVIDHYFETANNNLHPTMHLKQPVFPRGTYTLVVDVIWNEQAEY